MTQYLDKPQSKLQVSELTEELLREKPELTGAVAALYSLTLGKDGLIGEGHQPYWMRELFSEAALKEKLKEIRVFLAFDNAQPDIPIGAILAEKISNYVVELSSLVVRPDRQGEKLGSELVQAASDALEQVDFVVTSSALVTDAIAAQCAHFHAGYKRICGFGFCQYPEVFFKNNRESIVLVSKLQGKLTAKLKLFRSLLGRDLGQNKQEIVSKLVEAQSRMNSRSGLDRLSQEWLALAAELLRPRTCYIDKDYISLVESITFQFEDILDYRLCEAESKAENKSEEKREVTFSVVENPHAIVRLDYSTARDSTQVFDLEKLEQTIKVLQEKAPYILVQIPANDAGAPALIRKLKEQGFIFHSFLPLAGFREDSEQSFQDIFSMQWLSEPVREKNDLPGERRSRIKIYGYPENLSGYVLSTVARDLKEAKSKT